MNLADGGEIQALGIGARRKLFFGAALERREHVGFEMVQIVIGNRFPGGDRDRVAAAYFEHAAADREMMFGAAPVAPAHHGQGKRSQEVGMAWQDAEGTGVIFGAKVHDVDSFGDYRKRRRHSELHFAPFAAKASRCRASSRPPTM